MFNGARIDGGQVIVPVEGIRKRAVRCCLQHCLHPDQNLSVVLETKQGLAVMRKSFEEMMLRFVVSSTGVLRVRIVWRPWGQVNMTKDKCAKTSIQHNNDNTTNDENDEQS